MEASEIKNLLCNHHKGCSRYEINFILSHVNTMACFCSGNEEYHGIIAVTDNNYNPVFFYETNSYVNSCGISDDGKYAIFRTANSPNSDGNTTFFINVDNNSILWKKTLETSFKDVRGHYIDTDKKIIYETHDIYEAMFGFDGELIDVLPKFTKKILSKDYSHYSPYHLIDIAFLFIKYLEKNGFEPKKLIAATECIEIAIESNKLSANYIAGVYKSLGNYYESISDKTNALECYKKGLSYNPKLSVKKKIKNLELLLREDI